jgi:phosphoglycolate phosphatase
MSIKLICFDLDGTLLDTLGDIAMSMNQALIDHHFRPYETDRYKKFAGSGVNQLVLRALSAQNQDDTLLESVLKAYRVYYGLWREQTTRPYPGIRSMLADLARLNIKAAVLSNKPQSDTEKVIEHYFPGYPFAAVYGKRPELPLKPDPTSLNELIRMFGIRKDELLFIGDTDVDMMTAKNAGVTPVGVAWGFREPPELILAGAALVITAPDELIQWIERRDLS